MCAELYGCNTSWRCAVYEYQMQSARVAPAPPCSDAQQFCMLCGVFQQAARSCASPPHWNLRKRHRPWRTKTCTLNYGQPYQQLRRMMHGTGTEVWYALRTAHRSKLIWLKHAGPSSHCS